MEVYEAGGPESTDHAPIEAPPPGWVDEPDTLETVPVPEPQPSAEPPPDQGLLIRGFGETYAGNRGDVTVSEPEPYEPGRYAATSRSDKRSVIFTVTVQNNSAAVLEGAGWIASVTADGRTGNEIWDDNVGFNAPDILPGQTGTWRVGFGLPVAQAPADVVVGLSFGLTRTMYWQGPA